MFCLWSELESYSLGQFLGNRVLDIPAFMLHFTVHYLFLCFGVFISLIINGEWQILAAFWSIGVESGCLWILTYQCLLVIHVALLVNAQLNDLLTVSLVCNYKGGPQQLSWQEWVEIHDRLINEECFFHFLENVSWLLLNRLLVSRLLLIVASLFIPILLVLVPVVVLGTLLEHSLLSFVLFLAKIQLYYFNQRKYLL